MPISSETLVMLLLGIVVVVLAVMNILLLRRLNRANSAASTAALQPRVSADGEVLGTMQSSLVQELQGLDQRLAALHLAEQRDLSRYGLVRFSPYDDTGGDLSFALAIVSQEGNGVLLSSLHGRTTTRFYAKTIESWGCQQMLSDEEAEAVRRAQEMR
ncbi:MAG: DUF4446 family protein [Chloroflexi bacterium]|nr:DUF4446 family protein [Chloroflexota bacterium]